MKFNRFKLDRFLLLFQQVSLRESVGTCIYMLHSSSKVDIDCNLSALHFFARRHPPRVPPILASSLIFRREKEGMAKNGIAVLQIAKIVLIPGFEYQRPNPKDETAQSLGREHHEEPKPQELPLQPKTKRTLTKLITTLRQLHAITLRAITCPLTPHYLDHSCPPSSLLGRHHRPRRRKETAATTRQKIRPCQKMWCLAQRALQQKRNID